MATCAIAWTRTVICITTLWQLHLTIHRHPIICKHRNIESNKSFVFLKDGTNNNEICCALIRFLNEQEQEQTPTGADAHVPVSIARFPEADCPKDFSSNRDFLKKFFRIYFSKYFQFFFLEDEFQIYDVRMTQMIF